jgi:membrane associated rhomboid family serine protease
MHQFQAPPLTKTSKILIGITVGLFLINSILKTQGIALDGILGLSSLGMSKGLIFQIFTYPFIGRGLLEVVFNSLLLWFIGSEMESLWGIKRYLKFLATSVIGAGIIFLTIGFIFFSNSMMGSIPLTGLAGAMSALLLAYAIIFPDRTFSFMLIFPMKAKYFCMILIAMQLYMGFFSPAAILAWGHLGAMLSGFLFMLFVAKGGKKSEKRKVSSAKLKLVKNEEDDKPKYWH